MNELQIFTNPEFGKVRVVEVKGEPYFVGNDVAEILGYKNPRSAISVHVFKGDKVFAKCDTPGGPQKMTIVNESGVYALIFGSKLESAERFKHWVTSEVIPSIRKHGAYLTAEAADKVLQDPDFLIRLATELKEARLAKQKAEQELALAAPKVEAYDIFLDAEGYMNNEQLAKHIGIGRNKFIKLLREYSLLTDRNLPYQKHIDKGYCKIVSSVHFGKTYYSTVWTKKGINYVAGLYKYMKGGLF